VCAAPDGERQPALQSCAVCGHVADDARHVMMCHTSSPCTANVCATCILRGGYPGTEQASPDCGSMLRHYLVEGKPCVGYDCPVCSERVVVSWASEFKMGGDSSLKWLMGNAGVSLTLAKGSCECDDPDCSLRRDLSLQLRHCGDKTCAPLNRPGTTVCKGTSIRVFHECEMQKQFSL
jgi:hypothetical protein